MSAKKTLGYASRTDAVLALRSQGAETSDIARRIGIDTKTVAALESSALRRKPKANAPPEQLGRMVLIPLDVLNRMRRPAVRRGLTPHELAGVIVAAVVDGNLVDAVLDDDEARR